MSLVLTLKREDHINIDGPVTITYVEMVSKNQIRLCFDAPPTTIIERGNYVQKHAGAFPKRLKSLKPGSR